MHGVPLIDSAGATTLRKFLETAQSRRVRVILAGLRSDPASVLEQMGVEVERVTDIDAAVAVSRSSIGK